MSASASRLSGKPVADREADGDDGEHDRGVEQLSVPVRPRLEIAPPFAPHHEQEECDREEERNLENPADRSKHGLERQDDDNDRNHRHDAERTHERRNPVPDASHSPVMNARIASAPATSVVTENQTSRLGPTPGA